MDVNLHTLASTLKVPGVKLKDKGIQTILERVTNIKEITGHGIPEVRKALMESYSGTLGISLKEGGITEREKALAKELLEKKYGKKEWTHGRQL